MPKRNMLVVAALFALTGCYRNGPDVEEQAKEDLNCDHVEVRRTSARSSRSSCSSGDYVVEGCGQISFYRCTGCNGECNLLASNELRSN